MKIAIIGTGRVAAALGKGWAGRGHMVTFASRRPGSEKVAGRVDASGHAGRFINSDTALVGGLNLQHNLGSGSTSVKPEVGVQYKGVQVLFGYDAKEKAGTIRLGIPF